MIINVGSKNSNKLEAVRKAFIENGFSGLEVISCETDSGVSAQPIGYDEVILGAENRASGSFYNCDLSVGLESELISVPRINTGYMNITFCAIWNGCKFFYGLGSGFELPEKAVDLIINEKMEVDEAVYKIGLTKNPRIGYKEGISSVLTNGAVSREDHAKTSVEMALASMYGMFSHSLES